MAQARAALHGRTLSTLADDELGDALLRLRALDAVVTTLAREQTDADDRARRRAELDDRAEQLAAATERMAAELTAGRGGA